MSVSTGCRCRACRTKHALPRASSAKPSFSLRRSSDEWPHSRIHQGWRLSRQLGFSGGLAGSLSRRARSRSLVRGSLIGSKVLEYYGVTMEFLQFICHELWCVAASRARRRHQRPAFAHAAVCRWPTLVARWTLGTSIFFLSFFFVAVGLLRHSSSDAHRHRGSCATLMVSAGRGTGAARAARELTAPF